VNKTVSNAPLLLAFDVRDWPVLVVGGGRVALRKAETLVQCGARVTVIAPHILESTVEIDRTLRPYQSGDCAGFKLVFACTDNREVNALVAKEAKALGIFCNIADAPEESDFASCATVRRGDIAIGISSGGQSAALAKHLRRKIGGAVGNEYAQLAEILGARRAGFKQSHDADARADAWRAALESEALELLRRGERAAAETLVDEILQKESGQS
jgi:siroheme synthase-like protein